MSADHRRPLFAFVLVLVVCVIIMVNGLKGQAVVSALRTGAGHVVEGVELVTTRGDHGHRSRQLMEPPVLEAGATTVVVGQPPQPAAPAAPVAPVAPESSTTSTAPADGHAHAQQPSTSSHPHPAAGDEHGHASGHHGKGAQAQGRGHQSRASQGSAQQVVHGLSQQVEQLLGVHEGAGPSRGPGTDADQALGGGRGRDHGVRGHDRGHHLGQLLGPWWAPHR